MRVYILRGLPGSGKTTFCEVIKRKIREEFDNVNIVHANRDLIRKDFIESCLKGEEDDMFVDYAMKNWRGTEEENYQSSFKDHYINMVVQKKFQMFVEGAYYCDNVTDIIVDCTMISASDVWWLVNFWENRNRLGDTWKFYQLELEFKSTHDVPDSVMRNYRILKEKTQCYWDKISGKNKFIVK